MNQTDHRTLFGEYSNNVEDQKENKMNEDVEFVKKKGIRSKHLKECSWYQDDTTCDCDLFSPLGIYAPYIPLQISKIEITNDKESK